MFKKPYFNLIPFCFIILGHDGEISKVSFNPQGTKIITAGLDCTARIWATETGEQLQVLEGHTDEIFSCSFNYEGDIIITGKQTERISTRKVNLQVKFLTSFSFTKLLTGSKDNTCKIWKDDAILKPSA